MHPKSEVFDMIFIDRLFEVDKSGRLIVSLYEILEPQHKLFHAEILKLNKLVDQAIKANDLIEFSKFTHKMKSSYGNMGLVKLSHVAQNLEKLFSSEDFAKLEPNKKIELNKSVQDLFKDYLENFLKVETQSLSALSQIVDSIKKAAA